MWHHFHTALFHFAAAKDFAKWLRTKDAGVVAEKTLEMHVQRVEVLSSIFPFTDQITPASLWKDFYQPREGTCRPGTMISYISSHIRFMKFLATEPHSGWSQDRFAEAKGRLSAWSQGYGKEQRKRHHAVQHADMGKPRGTSH
jgi:hypothetical protein